MLVGRHSCCLGGRITNDIPTLSLHNFMFWSFLLRTHAKFRSQSLPFVLTSPRLLRTQRTTMLSVTLVVCLFALCTFLFPFLRQTPSRRGSGIDGSALAGKPPLPLPLSFVSPESMAPLRKRVGSGTSSLGGMEAIAEIEDEEVGIV